MHLACHAQASFAGRRHAYCTPGTARPRFKRVLEQENELCKALAPAAEGIDNVGAILADACIINMRKL